MMSLFLFAVALPWLLIAFGCWLGYQLVRQNGRILMRLEGLELPLATEGAALVPAGEQHLPTLDGMAAPALPPGSSAPEFELPSLAGDRTTLSQFRGRRVLLIFFNPRCSFCARMAADLAALPADGSDGQPVPVVISTGEVEANRKLAQGYGVRCPVLLQSRTEVADTYQAYGTPIGYVIDEEGRIASERVVGGPALLALAGVPGAAVTGGDARGAGRNGNGDALHRGNRPLADSKLNRNGLPAGTPAPGFVLPRVDGGELSLEEYRGRRVILVFSDPHCGPCDQLAPQLEQLSRRTPEVQVVMLSRRDMESNRAKVEEHGLTFPVVLQRQWEISRLYGIFGTPAAYLIDEEGIIVTDVAVGVEAILALRSRAGGNHGKRPMGRNGKEQLSLQS
jgi:peroxiredoxin